jgi:hypothetical protein
MSIKGLSTWWTDGKSTRSGQVESPERERREDRIEKSDETRDLEERETE